MGAGSFGQSTLEKAGIAVPGTRFLLADREARLDVAKAVLHTRRKFV